MSDVIRAEGRDTTYETALELHEAIMHSAQAAALSLMEMCRGLKKMRDTRLYESLGHSSFDDYCEKMAGIRARQAYTYIAVYERFGEARLAANASLGVTKLELISRLPFSEQDSVLEAAGLEGMSVAELRAMAEQYRTVGHQMDMFAAAEAEPETADAPGSVPEEVLEKVRLEVREESAAETAALRAQLEEAEAKHRAELEAEKARRRDEVEAAVKRRLKKESAEAAARGSAEPCRRGGRGKVRCGARRASPCCGGGVGDIGGAPRAAEERGRAVCDAEGILCGDKGEFRACGGADRHVRRRRSGEVHGGIREAA